VVSRIDAGAEQDSVLQEAAQWSLELATGDIPAERIAQWQQWLAASEAHRDAFDRIQSTWCAVDRYATGTVAWPSREEVASDAYDGSVAVSVWRARVAARRSSRRVRSWAPAVLRRHPWLTVGFAASAVAALTALAVLPVMRSVQSAQPVVTVVETSSGENRDVQLGDGSVVSAGARVVVGVSEGIVKVDAPAPAAATTVQGQPERPVIRTARLGVGQQLSIDAASGSASLQAVDVIGIAAWRNGLLQYRDEPLRSVIADLTRYSARDIVIANPQIADLRITGTVFANDVNSWLQSLETALPVRVVWAPDGSARLEAR
jgi:transmembrane sensor